MEDLFILSDADCKGTFILNPKTNEIESIPTHEEIKIKAREINEEVKKLSIKPFRYFNGNELMKEFKINNSCKAVGTLMEIQNNIIDEYGYELDKSKVLKLIKNRYNNIK